MIILYSSITRKYFDHRHIPTIPRGNQLRRHIHKEGFEELIEFKTIWREIYGNYDPEELVWVVEFQYVGNTDMFKHKPWGNVVGNRPKGVGPTRTHSELGS